MSFNHTVRIKYYTVKIVSPVMFEEDNRGSDGITELAPTLALVLSSAERN